jgi:hypothetical protein
VVQQANVTATMCLLRRASICAFLGAPAGLDACCINQIVATRVMNVSELGWKMLWVPAQRHLLDAFNSSEQLQPMLSGGWENAMMINLLSGFYGVDLFAFFRRGFREWHGVEAVCLGKTLRHGSEGEETGPIGFGQIWGGQQPFFATPKRYIQFSSAAKQRYAS